MPLLKHEINSLTEFLISNRLATIATISPNNKPQTALVYYIFDQPSRNIYILTYQNSRKLKNLSMNSSIAFQISQEVEPKIVQIDGEATVVNDLALQTDIISRLPQVANANPASTTQPPLFFLSHKSNVVTVKITINSFKYSDFSLNKPSIVTGTGKDLKGN